MTIKESTEPPKTYFGPVRAVNFTLNSALKNVLHSNVLFTFVQ